MPNRILRDWTDSEAINSLDWQEEVFFVRVIMKVDDYGRFTANPKLLRSLCFPLRDGIREADISRWLAACQKAGLLRLYSVADRPFLQIERFGQQKRSNSKYPPPDAEQVSSDCAADAQQVKANAHLGEGVFGDVVVGEGDPPARSDGVFGLSASKAGNPGPQIPSLSEVLQYCSVAGIPEPDGRRYYATTGENNAWIKNGHLIGWKQKFKRFAEEDRARGASGRGAGNGRRGVNINSPDHKPW